MKDNQNRNLESVKKHLEMLAQHSRNGYEKMCKEQESTIYPEWTEVKGIKVIRLQESKFVAAPVSGRKSSKWFDIIDIEAGKFICQIKKERVNKWLMGVEE